MLIVLTATICIVSLGVAITTPAATLTDPNNLPSTGLSPTTATLRINHIYYYDNGVKHEISHTADSHIDLTPGMHIIRFQVKAYYNGPSGTYGQVAVAPNAMIFTTYEFITDYKLLTDGEETTLLCYDAYKLNSDTTFYVAISGPNLSPAPIQYLITFDLP